MDFNMHDELVTDTVEYKGKKIKFALKKFTPPKDKNVSLLWYIEAWVDGFKKPFESKLITSIFARDAYEKAKELTDPQDYINALFSEAKRVEGTTCELLSADLDSVSIMWYLGGTVQVETDTNLVTMIKKLIDNLDQDISQLVLKNSGFL